MKRAIVLAVGASIAAAGSAGAQAADTSAAKRDSIARRLLPPVVVTATRTPKSAFSAPSPVTSIGSTTIRERMPTTIADLFRDQPGLDVDGVGTNQVRPSIHGQRGQRILLLEDGLRMNNSRRQQDFGELPTLAGMADIDRVEVVRGPASVLYGTDAIAGVVNVITKDITAADDRSLHGSASYIYGSADLQRTPSVSLEQRVGAFAFRFSGTTRQTQPYSAPAGTFGDITLASRQRVNDTGVNDNAASGTMSYDLTASQRLTAKYEQYDARNAGFGYVDPSVIGPDEPLISIRYPDQRVGKYSLRYEASTLRSSVADRVSLSAYRLDNTRHLSMNIFVPFGAGTPPGAGVSVGSVNFTDMSTIGLRAEATKGIAKHLITYGVDAFRDRSDNTDSSATTVVGFGPPHPQISTASQVPNAFFTSAGAFAQSELALGERLSLVLGGRAQRIEARTRPETGDAFVSKNNTVVGTANALYRVTSNLSLIASTGRGFRAANLVERFFDGPTPEGSGYQKANPNLRPETSVNVDVGARYQRGVTSAEVVAFQNTLHDGIRTSPTGDSVNRMPAYQNVNVDRLRFTGAEASAQTLLVNALLVRASYTRLQSHDVLNPNNAIGHTYSSKTIGEIEYRPIAPWWIGYTIRHNGRQTDGQLGDTPLGAEVPAFTIHSAHAGVRLFDRGRVNGTLNLALENAGNTLYAESANVGFFRPAPGRSFVAGWTLGF